ncbi:MAG: PadR family transcriptional regulator [Candidatus Micrarchaeota archaeon]
MEDHGAKGLVELFILNECSHKPLSGKDLMQKASELSKGKWVPSAGSVYPALAKMEKGGLVKSSLRKKGKGRREIAYELTAKGKHSFGACKDKIEEMGSVMGAVNPIFLRILQDLDDEETEEARVFWMKIIEFRKQLLAEPRQEVRHRRLVRMFRLFQKELDDAKKELGLRK